MNSIKYLSYFFVATAFIGYLGTLLSRFSIQKENSAGEKKTFSSENEYKSRTDGAKNMKKISNENINKDNIIEPTTTIKRNKREINLSPEISNGRFKNDSSGSFPKISRNKQLANEYSPISRAEIISDIRYKSVHSSIPSASKNKSKNREEKNDDVEKLKRYRKTLPKGRQIIDENLSNCDFPTKVDEATCSTGSTHSSSECGATSQQKSRLIFDDEKSERTREKNSTVVGRENVKINNKHRRSSSDFVLPRKNTTDKTLDSRDKIEENSVKESPEMNKSYSIMDRDGEKIKKERERVHNANLLTIKKIIEISLKKSTNRELLLLESGATSKDASLAFKRLALITHPDRCVNWLHGDYLDKNAIVELGRRAFQIIYQANENIQQNAENIDNPPTQPSGAHYEPRSSNNPSPNGSSPNSSPNSRDKKPTFVKKTLRSWIKPTSKYTSDYPTYETNQFQRSPSRQTIRSTSIPVERTPSGSLQPRLRTNSPMGATSYPSSSYRVVAIYNRSDERSDGEMRSTRRISASSFDSIGDPFDTYDEECLWKANTIKSYRLSPQLVNIDEYNGRLSVLRSTNINQRTFDQMSSFYIGLKDLGNVLKRSNGVLLVHANASANDKNNLISFFIFEYRLVGSVSAMKVSEYAIYDEREKTKNFILENLSILEEVARCVRVKIICMEYEDNPLARFELPSYYRDETLRIIYKKL